MAVLFRERTNDAEPAGEFSWENSGLTRTFVMYDDTGAGVSPFDVRQQTIRILGSTRAPGNGDLIRSAPMADADHPFLFADRVTVRVPRGELFTAATGDYSQFAIQPQERTGALWKGYEFDVHFAHRPYPILPNGRMRRRRLQFTDRDGVLRTLYYYEEWKRHAFYFPEPRDSFVSGITSTAMHFRAPGHATANNTPFTQVPDMILPDQNIFYSWYQIPQRYVDSPNSYLARYKGYVNQTAFQQWDAGSLLYLGYKILAQYTPPTLTPLAAARATDAILRGTYAYDRMVDVQLQFIHTVRDTPNPPAAPSNPNWIAAGHNLQPHLLSRRFFYASANLADVAQQVPSYFSVPFEVLFQDPSAGLLF